MTPSPLDSPTGRQLPAPLRSTAARTLALAVALAVIAATLAATSPRATASGAWVDTTRGFRVAFTVDPNGVDRSDTAVTFDVDLTTAFTAAGAAGATLETSSLRVVEVDGSGQVRNGNVPFQFDPASGFDATTAATGELTVLLDGATDSTRRYHLYFERAGVGGFTPTDHSGLGRVAVTENLFVGGRLFHRISTGGLVWTYDRAGGGFSSLVAGGAEWIGWNTAEGSDGMFRGIPNLDFPSNVFHPGHDVATTVVVSSGPLRAVIESTTFDGLWRARWAIHPDRVEMQVLSTPNGEAYWFQYEGTPGGALDANDLVLRSGGFDLPAINGTFAEDLPATEWAGVADTSLGWAFWMANLDDDAAVDTYSDLDDKMTVLAFGRSGLGVTQLLSGPKRFALGVAPVSTSAAVGGVVDAAVSPYTVNVAAGEAEVDATTSTTVAPLPEGYWILTSAGRMLPFGELADHGASTASSTPAVAAAATATGSGYWVVHEDGRVGAFGDAVHRGDASNLQLAAPIVGMAVTPSGGGYWLLGRDGGIFSYGDAQFFGSTGAIALKAPVTDMAATATGNGYHLVAEDGGIFAFGDAQFLGSTGAMVLDRPVTSMTRSAAGYWLVALDGGIFAFSAPFHGSLPGVLDPNDLPEGRRIRSVDDGAGYFIMSAEGGIYAFASAVGSFEGSGVGLLAPGEIAVDLVVVE